MAEKVEETTPTSHSSKEELPRSFETKKGEVVQLHVARDTKSITDEERKMLAEGMVAITEKGVLTIERAIQQMKNGNYQLYHITGEDNRMVAYATVFPSDEDSSCYINKIQVAPDKRGQGIAGFMLKQVMEDFDKVALVNIVQDHLLKARMARLYEKLGFVNEEEDRFVWEKAMRH